MEKTQWPNLPHYKDWKDTCDTLHRWIQIVGKVRTTHAPSINHSWNSTLYVTSQGLTTSLIPSHDRSFSIDFNFTHHSLVILTSDGMHRQLPLKKQSVAQFYEQFCKILKGLNIEIFFDPKPNEVPDPIPFAIDTRHSSYDPEAAYLYWQTLVQVNKVLQEFRSKFIGKCSPVHLFWGSLDLAVTRFSGRRAPEHPGGIPTIPDYIVKEAYSHEVSSCGFWPGNDIIPFPAFYSYAYPEPEQFKDTNLSVPGAFYHPKLKEFILPYAEVRKNTTPEAFLLSFFQNTYESAANIGHWDRPLLEESIFLKTIQEKHRAKDREYFSHLQKAG